MTFRGNYVASMGLLFLLAGCPPKDEALKRVGEVSEARSRAEQRVKSAKKNLKNVELATAKQKYQDEAKAKFDGLQATVDAAIRTAAKLDSAAVTTQAQRAAEGVEGFVTYVDSKVSPN